MNPCYIAMPEAIVLDNNDVIITIYYKTMILPTWWKKFENTKLVLESSEI